MRCILACPTLALALAACTTAASRDAADSAAVTFIVVRHAEKGGDDPRDPSLSAAGRARAQALAKMLADAPLRAAYATAYRRTQQTARAAAAARGIAVTVYDARQPASAFASQLRAAHAAGTVLVVGHSNTVPEIVAALSAQTVEPMAETEFDRLYRVRIVAGGTATLERSRY